jgi:hypothetical protein
MGWEAEWCGESIDAEHTTMHQLIKRFGLRIVELGGGRRDWTRSVLYFSHRYYRAQELAKDFEALKPLLQRRTACQGVLFPEGA